MFGARHVTTRPPVCLWLVYGLVTIFLPRLEACFPYLRPDFCQSVFFSGACVTRTRYLSLNLCSREFPHRRCSYGVRITTPLKTWPSAKPPLSFNKPSVATQRSPRCRVVLSRDCFLPTPNRQLFLCSSLSPPTTPKFWAVQRARLQPRAKHRFCF